MISLNKLKNNIKSDFGKSVIKITSSSLVAQIVPVFISPVLTRLFSPAEFGLLALFNSTGLLLANIATFQYDQAIVLPKRNKDAISLFFAALFFVFILSMICFVSFLFNQNAFLELIDNRDLKPWLLFIPIYVLLAGSNRVFYNWALRFKKYNRIATRNIVQSGSTAGTKVIMGFFKNTSGGLIIGSLTGQFITTTLLAWQTFRLHRIRLNQTSFKRIWLNIKLYKQFPLFTNWQSFFNMFSNTGSNYIIANIFNTSILGMYSFTYGILLKPLQILGQSISGVFYPEITERYNSNKELWPYIKKLLVRLIIAGLIVFTPILLFGQLIFGLFFGPEWVIAGKYAQLLSPWLFAKFVFSPISTIPIVLKKQKMFFFIHSLTQLTIPIIFYSLPKIRMDFNFVLICVSAFGFVSTCLIILWIRRIAK